MPKGPDWEAMWRRLRAEMKARKDIGDFPLVADMMDEIEAEGKG